MQANFSYHHARSELQELRFGDCMNCQATVVRARVKKTLKDLTFDPKPTGGTEIDPVYSVHKCPK